VAQQLVLSSMLNSLVVLAQLPLRLIVLAQLFRVPVQQGLHKRHQKMFHHLDP
jgi:hypothetical protein